MLLVLLAACTGGDKDRPSGSKSASLSGTKLVSGSLSSTSPRFGREACGLAVTSEYFWVLDCSGTMFQVARDTLKSQSRSLGAEVLSLHGIVSSSKTLWIMLYNRASKPPSGSLVVIGGPDWQETTEVPLGTSIPIAGMLFRDKLWIAAVDGRLLSLEAQKPKEVAPKGTPLALVAGTSIYLWTIDEAGGVTQRDASSGRIQRSFKAIAPGATGAAKGIGSSVWIALGDGGVLVINGESGRSRPLGLEGNVNDIEQCGGSVWISQQELGGSFQGRFGLRSLTEGGDVLKTIPLGVVPTQLRCDGSRLWILGEAGQLGFISV